VTTYDTIKSEYEAYTAVDTPESSEKEKGNSKGKTKRKAPKKAAIFEVQWFRVILGKPISSQELPFVFLRMYRRSAHY